MSDTIYYYQTVELHKNTAIQLGYLSPSFYNKLDYVCNIRGRFCIQIDRPPQNTKGLLKYKVSYAFCSPHDNFSKKVARSICRSRSNSGCYLEISSTLPLTAKQLSEKAIELIAKSCGHPKAAIHGDGSYPVKIPDWLSLSVKNWYKVKLPVVATTG